MVAVRAAGAGLILLASLIGWAAPGLARETPTAVDLELVLAVDVSMSMDMSEQRLQREGYVRALRDPDVVAAITDGVHGRIAIAYMEWAGEAYQRMVVPWTLVDGAETANDLADTIGGLPYMRAHRTSISAALGHANSLFADSGFEGIRRVIDVSGDGPNNQGRPILAQRDEVLADGVVINGLAIMTRPSSGFGGMFDISKLDHYYEHCVIGGPGAFVVPVTDASEFTSAIRRKMILEIAGIEMRAIPAAAYEPVDCLIGERQWNYWMERQE